MVHLFIFYVFDLWLLDLNTDFTLGGCLLEAAKLTQHADPGKNSYPRYGIEFDSRSLFSLRNFNVGKNLIIFKLANSSSV